MRVDSFLVLKGYYSSRTKATQSISKNEVYIDGLLITKPSFNIDENIEHKINRVFQEDYVSLGGFKMSKALKEFNFPVENFTCLDIGASTGGFTDCLLQNNAKKIYAVDLNDSLLSPKLKQDKRVVPIIKNAKDLKKNDFNEKIDLITADLSFISETLIIPIIADLLDSGKNAIILIKPQFELNKKIKMKNGIVKDEKQIKQICKKIIDFSIQNSLYPKAITNAPNSAEKNREFLLLLIKDFDTKITSEQLK